MSTKDQKTVCVLGAGGKTGKECVKILLEKGFAVKAVVRSPDKYKDYFAAISSSPSLQLIAGDVTQPDTLPEALNGCNGGVIFSVSGTTYFSPNSVDHLGVKNVVYHIKESSNSVATSNSIGRLVLVSSCLVTPANWLHPLRILLNNIRYGLMDAKFKGEEILRKSGLDYCVVRPGGLTDTSGGESLLAVAQGDRQSGMISRSDVAAVCVAALSNPSAGGTTFELFKEACKEKASKAMPLNDQLRTLFDGLKKDSS